MERPNQLIFNFDTGEVTNNKVNICCTDFNPSYSLWIEGKKVVCIHCDFVYKDKKGMINKEVYNG